jgi:hypothetical protein
VLRVDECVTKDKLFFPLDKHSARRSVVGKSISMYEFKRTLAGIGDKTQQCQR